MLKHKNTITMTVLKFSAAWCGPCKILSETLKNVDGIETIDIDKDEETTAKYSIKSVPTLVFTRYGEEVGRVSGNISLNQYYNLLETFNE